MYIAPIITPKIIPYLIALLFFNVCSFFEMIRYIKKAKTAIQFLNDESKKASTFVVISFITVKVLPQIKQQKTNRRMYFFFVCFNYQNFVA